MAKSLLTLRWQTILSDYVTAIAWSPNGSFLAVASAAGEVVLLTLQEKTVLTLREKQGFSVDAIAFSADGQFLATGGQDGTVRIWQMGKDGAVLLTELENKRVWVDCLRWHPRRPELAFAPGKYTQIWDGGPQTVVATINFAKSSVLDMAWEPSGNFLVLAGNQSLKVWKTKAWDDDPHIWDINGASEMIAFSPNGQYLASGNNDRTLLVWEWGNLDPWQMQGFTGKVRHLAWSMKTQEGSPLLVSSSGKGLVAWVKAENDDIGWSAQPLDLHNGTITAIAFKPHSTLLASASEDGLVCLWKKASHGVQILEGASAGFSALAWSPQGNYLAAGGCGGEVLLWAENSAGKGSA
ncbi:WD40 repeat domain-containing protein [Synechocystis salina LEGE 06099]|uniref:WD40 repeat domain-containing protein n=1 Tax=Synechocystis salina TaxID=945780 RepID=UPI0018828505|nr:WD40 repeat domain-containing protein [Synechocystis salina]MBE9204727.1 WD40 repeat domain-containing protein [Synechocystis salina LEGE 06099]